MTASTTVNDLPTMPPDIEALWARDSAGAGDLLIDSDIDGLLQLLPGMALAFRHEDVRALASNPSVGNVPADVLAQLMSFIGFDDPERGFIPVMSRQVFAFNPPLHAPTRRILTRQMTPSNVGRFAELAQAILDELLLEVDGGAFDLCRDLAYRFAARFWGALVGLNPDEVREVERLTQGMSAVFLNAPTPEQVNEVTVATEKYVDLVTRAVARTRRGESDSNPLAVDMLREFESDLRSLAVRGAPESAGEFAAGNFFDGFHTSGVGIANALCLLLEQPDAYARVRADPTLAGSTYDEATRLAPPLLFTYHQVIDDFVHGGVAIPAGTLLVLHWGAANRDPRVFVNPGAFEFERGNADLLTFGRGPHICPGRSVSRLLGGMAIASVTSRPWRLRIDAPGPSWERAASAMFMTSCPVTPLAEGSRQA